MRKIQQCCLQTQGTFTDETHGSCWKHLVCQIAPHFSRLISTKLSDSWQQRMLPYFSIVPSPAYTCSYYNRSIRLFKFLVFFNISINLKNDSQLNSCIVKYQKKKTISDGYGNPELDYDITFDNLQTLLKLNQKPNS